jgi:hypothetical protein
MPGFSAAEIPAMTGRTVMVTGANSGIGQATASALGNRLIAQDANGGALPVLYAAVAAVPGGSFAGPGRFFGLRGGPKLVATPAAARDGEAARRLWAVSEQLTGVRFPCSHSASRQLRIRTALSGQYDARYRATALGYTSPG